MLVKQSQHTGELALRDYAAFVLMPDLIRRVFWLPQLIKSVLAGYSYIRYELFTNNLSL